ncbi:cytosolic carboxypeptidase 1-like isoform X2 [Hetaerina americana]|uniref:cytosolic carboxypeptidase 1-like isoform X2 n=1 Tax=Hetaerina americana TaxID=62018 RepID=UPI003A7F16B1
MSEDASTALVFEKIKFYAAKPNENLDNLRHAVSRLNYQALNQDKATREKTLDVVCRKQSGNLTFLLNLLADVHDVSLAYSLASILHECVSPKPGVRRNSSVSQLIHANACRVLVKLIVQHTAAREGCRQSGALEPLVAELIMALSPLALKDSKFSIKARLLGSVKVFCSLLKTYINHSKLLLPILQIIKALSKSAYTTPLLVKNGALNSLEKAIVTNGMQPTPKFRVALDVLNHLSKNKMCCIKLTKTSLIHCLLRVIESSEKYEGKVKVKICKPVLLTLQHLATSKGGRKYIKENNGMASLYKFCSTSTDEKTNDSLLAKVCGVLNYCLENKDFPLGNLKSPAVFSIPSVHGSSDLLASSLSSGDSINGSGDESNDEEDLDDAMEDLINTDIHLRDEPDIYLPQRVQRNSEELLPYRVFVPEVLPDGLRHSTLPEGMIQVVGEKSLTSQHANPTGEGLKSMGSTDLLGWTHPSKSVSSEDLKRRSSLDLNLKTDVKVIKTAPDGTKEQPLNDIETLFGVGPQLKAKNVYSVVASRTKSVLPFVKTAYPELVGAEGIIRLEPFHLKDRTVCRNKLLLCIERSMHPNSLLNNVVFDLDELLRDQEEPSRELMNADESRIGEKDPSVSHLKFESRFECGNLRKVIQIGPFEYNLILTPDVNSSKHLQWFYFEVSNMEANKPYVFNIINCEKQNSQFNFGMKPLMFSVCDAVRGQPKWVRVGTDICYFRNSYQNPTTKGKTYVTSTFTIAFPYQYDVCYIAYHYPYSYSMLMTQIWKLTKNIDVSSTYLKVNTLCSSINNNPVPLLTVTAHNHEKNKISDRKVIVLTARVHPGECNSSWVMTGVLNFLLGSGQKSSDLRKKYLFKIIPMLNVDGVINGCDRCGLTDEDLNRCWIRPDQYLHPEIYHTKGLVECMVRDLNMTPFLYCDFHGHSRRKNVFVYGCSREHSWVKGDRSMPEDPVNFLMLPHLMDRFNPAFSLSNCNFTVEKTRESTARVTFWREFGIKRSYTMESTYCGMDQGALNGYHINTAHLKEVGVSFCEALLCISDENGWRMALMLDHSEANPLRLVDDVTKSLCPA